MEHLNEERSGLEARVETRCSNVEASNPVLAGEEGAEKLKGDAIGNTLYSESGLLKTLISLSKVFKIKIFSDYPTILAVKSVRMLL